MTDSTTEGLKDVEPWIWEFVKAVFPEAPHLAMSSFDERHALETATTTLAHQRATIERLEGEREAWIDRHYTAVVSWAKWFVRANKLDEENAALRQQLTEAHAEIGELHERVRAQARALEGMYGGQG